MGNLPWDDVIIRLFIVSVLHFGSSNVSQPIDGGGGSTRNRDGEIVTRSRSSDVPRSQGGVEDDQTENPSQNGSRASVSVNGTRNLTVMELLDESCLPTTMISKNHVELSTMVMAPDPVL